MVVAALGAMAAGSQVVLLNPFYTERELEPILADAEAAQIVCSTQFADLNAGVLKRVGYGTKILSDEPFESFVKRSRVAISNPLLMPAAEALAVLQYTGGTTGRSKGVNLTHGATAVNIVQCEELLPTRFMSERFLCMTPLFHAYAKATSFFPAIYSAGTLVVLRRYEAGLALETIAKERITLFGGAPTIYNGLIAHANFELTDYTSLVGALSGAAPLSLATLYTWERVTGVPIAEGYGLTEATAVLCFNPLRGIRKPGSVGLPLPQTEVQIVDKDDGKIVLGVNAVGEIRARGPQLMQGYRNRPDATAELVRDGWLYSGDIGEIDEDGYVFIRDRKKDMAIVGGYNVFPREVDEVLSSHPDVIEAVSAGVPDFYRGELVQACVKLRQGSECVETDLIEFCSGNLAHYKVPERIYFVDEIAKTAAGKIDRRSTREWLMSRVRKQGGRHVEG
jgi:long-chain acyl-CoA synthetase